MQQSIQRQSLYRRLAAISLSAAMLLLPSQRQAGAAEPNPATWAKVQPLEFFQELPPLGEATKYLPPDAAVMRLVLKLGERRVYLYRGNQVEVTYPVAVGKEGWETPTGSFQVLQKIEDPRWQNPWTGEVMPPGPDTALGLRWIGFWTNGQDFIGFHGTPSLNSIGQAASHGCVRMKNEDVVALFEKVQIGTPVIVEP